MASVPVIYRYPFASDLILGSSLSLDAATYDRHKKSPSLKYLKPKPAELLTRLKDVSGLLESLHSFVGKFAFESLASIHADHQIDHPQRP